MFTKLLQTEDDKALTTARMLLGFLFFVRGAQGLLGWFGGPGISDSLDSFIHLVSVPAPLVLLAAFTAFFGGIGLIAGLFTRIAAAFAVADAAFTLALWAIDPRLFADWSVTQGGAGIEYYLLAFALALILVVKGAGAFSVDRLLLWREPRHNTPRAKDSFIALEGLGPKGQPTRNHQPLHVLPRALPGEETGRRQKVR